MKSMSNTEDIVNNFLNKKEQTTFEQIKNSIKISKKLKKIIKIQLIQQNIMNKFWINV